MSNLNLQMMNIKLQISTMKNQFESLFDSMNNGLIDYGNQFSNLSIQMI